MRCHQCGTENPESAKFCLECGAKLADVCPHCRLSLPPQAKFCLECGAPVGRPQEAPSPREKDAFAERLQRLVPREYAERLLAARGQLSHERRLVTILFSDVKDSTAMAENLDPEDVLEIMEGAFEVLIDPVVRHEGTLARLMGDAVLAFFGAPLAHEDDPERACRAALEITAGAQRYAEQLERESGIHGFNVRVGIHTGLVVVGEVGTDLRMEYTAMGDAINLAARMESAAEPGAVLITEATHKLVASLFETEALGPIAVKGKAEPVSVYRVLAPKLLPRKVRGIAGLESPLVGREAELAALREAAEHLQVGVGGVVTVVGEAGIGKSRLVAEARNQAVVGAPVGAQHAAPLQGPQWVEGRCLSYGTSSAYLLWSDVLRGLLGVTVEDSRDVVGDALRQMMRDLCRDSLDDVCPYLGRMMSLPLTVEEEALLQGLEGKELKANTLIAVTALIECAASARSLVLVCEDLHWADPSSLELLEHLLRLTDRAPLLFICVFRPERDHGSWKLREVIARDYGHRHTDLRLDPLTLAESAALVGNLLWLEDLPPELKEHILDHAEGNPFYLEEVIRSLIDNKTIVQDIDTGRWRATRELASIAVPETLQGVLVARIDRLQEESKRVLQMASVIGRIFLYRVLEAVATEERELDRHLLDLQREEMIRERARIPEPEYIFKHELTREAAYNGLLRRERSAFHRQVAKALERLFPDRIEERVELLAHHWERAEEPERAIHYLQQAGARAGQLSANEEAIAHYCRGLDVLESMPDTPDRARQELALLTGLAIPLIAARGYGDPHVGSVVGRALEVGRRVGESPQLFLPLLALGAFYGGRGDYRTAQVYWEELLRLAERVGDPVLGALSHWLGWVPLFLGEPARALVHLEQVIDLPDREQDRALRFTYGVDPRAVCRIWASWALWLLGYPTQAEKQSQKALALAQLLEHPHTLAFVLSVGCETHRFRRDAQATQEWAGALASLLTEHPFEYWMARSMAIQGWMLTEQGEVEKGVALIRQSLAGTRSAGSEMYAPVELARMAQAFGRTGQIGQGLLAIDEALAVAHGTGERYYEAEIHRLKGELLRTQAEEEGTEERFHQAEICFRNALEIAGQQGAKSWELRSTVSLSRLLQGQGRLAEAKTALAGIYGWFSEGFDTLDLQEARALLKQLS